MTEIERLEAEIAEKRAELKRLKEDRAAGNRLNFKKYRMFGKGEYAFFAGSDSFIAPLRDFVLRLSTVHIRKGCGIETSIGCYTKKIKVADVSEDKLRVCNEFIDEIHPIVAKYVDIFAGIGGT